MNLPESEPFSACHLFDFPVTDLVAVSSLSSVCPKKIRSQLITSARNNSCTMYSLVRSMDSLRQLWNIEYLIISLLAKKQALLLSLHEKAYKLSCFYWGVEERTRKLTKTLTGFQQRSTKHHQPIYLLNFVFSSITACTGCAPARWRGNFVDLR